MCEFYRTRDKLSDDPSSAFDEKAFKSVLHALSLNDELISLALPERTPTLKKHNTR
jgi:hypothetical protein